MIATGLRSVVPQIEFSPPPPPPSHILTSQKEELLKKEKQSCARVQQDLNSLQKNHDIVKAELESLRMVAAIQESTKMDEIEHVKRQCQEEVGFNMGLMGV